jgi:hypothetical protein
LKPIEISTKLAWHFVGKLYKWGGDDPTAFDCSGLVVELLKSSGKLPRSGDWTANGLQRKFTEVFSAGEGILACYWNRSEDRIVHIEYCIDEHTTIGASGGGSRTKTVQDAIAQNAYIKVRPINYSRGAVSFVDPFLEDR